VATTDANGNVTGTFSPYGRLTNATLSGRALSIGQLAMTGGRALDPGNYDVAVFCRQINSGGGAAPVKVTQADLTAEVVGLSQP
jgi:hypothetical protein